MFALSVRQPWAWALLYAGKDIENRQWKFAPRYTGPLLIHTGKSRPPHDDYAEVRALSEVPIPPRHLLPLGGYVGLVMVGTAHSSDDCRTPKSYDPDLPFRTCSRWAQPFGGYHLPVSDPRPFPTLVEAQGQLGFWRPTMTPDLAFALGTTIRRGDPPPAP